MALTRHQAQTGFYAIVTCLPYSLLNSVFPVEFHLISSKLARLRQWTPSQDPDAQCETRWKSEAAIDDRVGDKIRFEVEGNRMGIAAWAYMWRCLLDSSEKWTQLRGLGKVYRVLKTVIRCWISLWGCNVMVRDRITSLYVAIWPEYLRTKSA